MLTREQLEKMAKKPNKICMSTVCTLPSGSLETITNYHELDEKFEYLLNAYGSDLKLKTKKEIRLLACLLVCEEDLN